MILWALFLDRELAADFVAIDVSVLRLQSLAAGASLGLQGGSGSPNGSVARRSATVAVLL